MMTDQYKPTYLPMIRDLPSGERPRERLVAYGADKLSVAELIAILLRGGTPGENVLSLATRVLTKFNGLRGLTKAELPDICEFHGIGEAKACQLIAALELAKRLAILTPDERPVIQSAEDVHNLLGEEMVRLEQEKLTVLLLNNKNELIANEEIYRGTVNSAGVRVSEILRPAVRRNCPNIIIVHNHPSGDPTPSPEDILVTRRLNQSAEMLDIKLLDHIVIGDRRFISMKLQQLGF